MAQLIGQQISSSTEIEKMVKNLVDEVTRQNSQIKGIKPIHPEHSENGKKMIERAGTIRGTSSPLSLCRHWGWSRSLC